MKHLSSLNLAVKCELQYVVKYVVMIEGVKNNYFVTCRQETELHLERPKLLQNSLLCFISIERIFFLFSWRKFCHLPIPPLLYMLVNQKYIFYQSYMFVKFQDIVKLKLYSFFQSQRQMLWRQRSLSFVSPVTFWWNKSIMWRLQQITQMDLI